MVKSKKFLFALLLLAVFEKAVLLYLGKAIVGKDDVFIEYIESLGKPAGSSTDIGRPAYDCVSRSIALIYSFKMCVDRIRPAQDTGESRFVLTLIKPAGYFTLIPRNHSDRILWDGIDIFYFNQDKRIVRDLRN